jgi:amino-acid N-acetyltransferase
MATALQSKIRRGGTADLPAAIALLKGTSLPTSDLMSAKELQLWVFEANESFQGVVALERFGSDALLRSLMVAVEQRNRGLGHELVAHLEHDAKADGIEQLVLLTETAQVFFQKLGYEVIDRGLVSESVWQSAEFRSLCPASAVCMRKVL